MIYFYCPKPPNLLPSGGIWFIHRIVGLLNEIDIPARVWTPNPIDVYWDAHPIDKSLVTQSIRLGQGDTLVVPEVNWPMAQVQGVRNILFVQNYVWLNKAEYFSNPGEVLVCSRFLFNHMRRVFDSHVIGKVTPFLDDDVWQDSPKQGNRVLVIGRRTETWRKMVELLNENGFVPEVIEQPLTHRQLSESFSRCEYYVHLVYPEGFPIICLEAMRSGTLVVGTTGGGGTEFLFDRETSFVVQDPESGQYFSQDQFCERIISKLREIRNDSETKDRVKNTAMEWSKRYTADATKKELMEIFGNGR